MRDLPVVFKAIINILLFVFYAVLAGVLTGIAYGWVLTLLGKSIPHQSNPVNTKIFILVALVVLIVTMVLRRYFYLCLENKKQEVVVDTTQDEGLKIQIEKEIK